MTVKLLTEHHLEFSNLKREAAQARLSLHLSNCHIVENHCHCSNEGVCPDKKIFSVKLFYSLTN